MDLGYYYTGNDKHLWVRNIYNADNGECVGARIAPLWLTIKLERLRAKKECSIKDLVIKAESAESRESHKKVDKPKLGVTK